MQGYDYSGHISPSQPANQVAAPDSVYLQSVVATPHPNLPEQAWRGLVTNDGWKYVCLPNQHWMLFDLNDDPYEMANLAHINQYVDKRQELLTRLKQWAVDTDDTFDFPE